MRHQDFRNSRRRNFDADTYHPQPRVLGIRPRFNRAPFQAPSDGSGDAFLHGSVLAQRGVNSLQPGETLDVRVGPGHKGPLVTEVLSVDASTAAPVAQKRSSFRVAGSSGPPSGESVEEAGTVKWFNVAKGYGFIARDSGEGDVFVHVSALEESGLTALSEGQPIVIDVIEGRKGPEAARVRLI